MAEPTAEEIAFLEAIRSNPDEDGPRLVYADWLEERGDPRGDFIRTHCQMQAMLGRLDYLNPQNWGYLWSYFPMVEDWLGPIPNQLNVVLERGLPVARMELYRLMELEWGQLLSRALAWFVRLDLTNRTHLPGFVPPTAAHFHPWSAVVPPIRLELMDAPGRYASLEFVRVLSRRPGQANTAALPRLIGLNLAGHRSVTDDLLASLAEQHELTELVLGQTSVTDAGLDYLTALNRLGRLDLCGTLVTRMGVERLPRALPDCRIVCDPDIDPRYNRLHAWRGMEIGW